MNYEELLEKAREIYESEDTPHVFKAWLLANIIGPADESEDEKNIKDLIDELKCSLRAANCQNNICRGGHEKRIALLEWGIAWLKNQGKQKQTWKPTAAQLIVIKDLIEDENTSKVNKVILRGMLDEFKQYFGL